MTFRPLFFLPRRWLLWAYKQALWERLFDTPVCLLFTSWDSHGVWFPWRGDEVLWTWPWTRKGLPPLVSLLASGTGEFGDSRFKSLAELDGFWRDYEIAIEVVHDKTSTSWEGVVAIQDI